MTGIEWTHPSVLMLLQQAGVNDPVTTIEHRARDVALSAMEQGWSGPPYDPFQLADSLNIELVARQDLDDARLVSLGGHPRIEFNPARRPARVRFSIAHEIGHSLFSDYGDRIRYRDVSERRSDDWQLEILCNIAAAEVLMPIGAFPIAETEDLSLPHLMDQRSRFHVSTEALLRRVVKLTGQSSAVFAATRLEGSEGFRVDYLVGSRAWTPAISPGRVLAGKSVLNRCTAVGFSDDGTEQWGQEELRVQAVGAPPYPGHRFPRLIGLLEPATGVTHSATTLRYVRGDASEPHSGRPAVIAHIVNDRARGWGGRGFASSLISRFPDAREQYSAWASSGQLRRGAVHIADADEGLWIASLVAQAGYGEGPMNRARLRLGALRESLEQLAQFAVAQGADIHMPAIGTGQAGGHWPEIRDLILEELSSRHVATTVYVLPDTAMPEDAPADEQLRLL